MGGVERSKEREAKIQMRKIHAGLFANITRFRGVWSMSCLNGADICCIVNVRKMVWVCVSVCLGHKEYVFPISNTALQSAH